MGVAISGKRLSCFTRVGGQHQAKVFRVGWFEADPADWTKGDQCDVVELGGPSLGELLQSRMMACPIALAIRR